MINLTKTPRRVSVDFLANAQKLFGTTLVKDLMEDEQICPVCNGLGIEICQNQYWLKDGKKVKFLFPYSKQSFTFCHNCYNGVVKICRYCGQQLERGICKCEDAQNELKCRRLKAEKAIMQKAEKFESNALGERFVFCYSKNCKKNNGFFESWEEFFDYYKPDGEERPEYVYGTEPIEMQFDAYSIIESACEEMYEDAFSDISSAAVKEMQDFFDAWIKKNGLLSYQFTNRCIVKIPWGD